MINNVPQKITKIQNVGKFHKGGVSGGEYGKYTLFYAGNGRGKTTICAVLRSMKVNDPMIVQERRTLGATGTPEVQLLLDSGPAVFSGGAWKNGAAALHVFDGAFVTANVHAGEEVSTDHRRSIYRIIVGAKGVQLAEEVDALDATITSITTKIASEKKSLQQHVPSGTAFEKFLGFAEDPEIDAKIAEQVVKIAAASQAVEIAAKPLLKPSTIPTLPTNFLLVLARTAGGVSKEAAQKVAEHLSKHNWGGDGEQWIAAGLAHVQDDKCPFCENSVQGNLLIEMYSQYFDQSYKAFKEELAGLQSKVLSDLSEAEGLKTKTRFEDLAKAVQYWKAFGNVSFLPAIDLDRMLGKLAALHDEAKKAINAKIAAPLEPVDMKALEEAFTDWQGMASSLQACNDSVAHANSDIQAIKDATAGVDKAALDVTLRELEAIKKRHAPQVTAIADSYNALVTTKNALVAEKDKKKEDLDAYDASMLPKYHDSINTYLTQFGAGFRLMKSEKTYQGKVPQWIYTIEVNKHPVDVTKKSGNGEPTFQSVMSAGDKSTLALAFFLAQLDLDPGLTDAIVVFDDPFTSLDEFRKAMTARTIFRIGQAASQVIVFSHDKYFLEAVASTVFGAKCETFQISSTKINSCIEAWDLAREVKDGYLRAHMDMLDFHSGKSGTASEMRLKMRPLLESYIRYRFPNQIADGKWLGDMLATIKADPNHPLISVYQDIDDVNSFTAPFHHDPSVPFNEDEVKTYVERTLAVVGGC
ncbi:MAG: AAA family ATPase [Rhodospirillaceae bacterium]|nr:AAA family ATPase [Rhodospirillaceae bacterium]